MRRAEIGHHHHIDFYPERADFTATRTLGDEFAEPQRPDRARARAARPVAQEPVASRAKSQPAK
jgi:hypothetical protein